MNKSVTLSFILRKDKQKSNGECPLMLCISKNRKRSYVSLGINMLPEHWDADAEKPKKKCPHQLHIENIIENKRSSYRQQILLFQTEGKAFTSETLRNTVEEPNVIKIVWDYYDEQINIEKKRKPKSANAFVGSRNSLRKFYGNKDLLFSDIDVRFLKRYEEWMRQQNLKETSMSAYLRSLRTLFNIAISEKIVKRDYYPFDEYKISQFNTATQKRAITKAELHQIRTLQLEVNTKKWEARQYFIFMYFGQGINFNDMALLKWSDLDNDRIRYIRTKTGQHINFKLSEYAQAIIESFRPETGDRHDNYIFPILNQNEHQTPIQIDNRLHKVLSQINKNLKEIATVLQLSVNLTTYVARHTYATVLNHSGADITKISQALGHTNLRTTQIYLKSFGDEEIDKMNEDLL